MRKIKTKVKQRWLSRYFRLCVKDEKIFCAIALKKIPKPGHYVGGQFLFKNLSRITKYNINQFINTIEHKALVKIWKLKREVKKIDLK